MVVQTGRCPQHLVDHGPHAVALAFFDELALVVKCFAGGAQRKLFGR